MKQHASKRTELQRTTNEPKRTTCDRQRWPNPNCNEQNGNEKERNEMAGLMEGYKTDSQWLKADDIGKGELLLTITEVGETTFQDGRRQKTLSFEETEKKLGLNKTNAGKLAEMFGDPDPDSGDLDVDPDDLIGKVIACYRTKTNNPDGQLVPCVRIRAPRTGKATEPQAPADHRPKGVSNDLPAQQMKDAARQAAKGAKAAAPVADEEDDADPFQDQ